MEASRIVLLVQSYIYLCKECEMFFCQCVSKNITNPKIEMELLYIDVSYKSKEGFFSIFKEKTYELLKLISTRITSLMKKSLSYYVNVCPVRPVQ